MKYKGKEIGYRPTLSMVKEFIRWLEAKAVQDAFNALILTKRNILFYVQREHQLLITSKNIEL